MTPQKVEIFRDALLDLLELEMPRGERSQEVGTRSGGTRGGCLGSKKGGLGEGRARYE